MADETLEIINDLEDFDLEETKFTYEVYALGYDDHYNAMDFECLIEDGYDEPEEAKKCFDFFIENKSLILDKITKADESVTHVNLVLEQCIVHEDGDVECIDILEEEEIF